ncbi:MAG: mycothiol conjugate amidase Mca [Propioniciclava sp.]|uniref:mycothiol conjugate amidase Mca n=1 Tax=Propioniciclava sp. TaxID=2038686 RepID=UPI0039E35D55
MPSDPQPLRVDAAGEPLRLLAVHAHPDDESSKGAATVARYVSEGVQVLVVTCTGGERGDILNPALDTPENWQNIATLREAEMARAREILGVQQQWLGYVDSGLPQGDPLPPLPEGCFALADVTQAASRLATIIRRFRPHVLTTYDENGGYPHPDHVQTHNISLPAVDLAADPDAAGVEGEPWQVLKVYYHMTFHRSRAVALDEVMHEHGLDSPYRERLKGWPEDPTQAARLTTFVPCGDYFAVRDDALRAHATQIDPDGFWFAVPLALQQRAWPTEDYQLVKSRVPTFVPEDDLFAGIDTHDGSSVDAWFYSI